MSMKILITGAAGFIGSNLCEYMLEKKHVVVGLDNFATGLEKNIDCFRSNKNFSFIQGDIRDLKTCNKATENIDVVLHQAALGSVPRSIKDPLTTNDVNINGFLNILQASKKNNVKRVVYASSSSTYGDSKFLPKIEDIIGTPLSPYAVSKYVNELYANVFANTYRMELIGLRYFNVFGRRQTPDGIYAAVIPKFINQFLIGQSPVINGDGNFSRDFTYVDNILQMNYLAMTTEKVNSINQIYNAAVGDRISIREMAESIKMSLIKYKQEIKNIPIINGPERVGDIPHSQASIEKAKKLLNYKPSHNFREGLEASIEWYYKNLNYEI